MFSLVPHKHPPYIFMFRNFDQKMVKFDVKCVLSCKIIIFYLDFVFIITSSVQMLISDLLSPPMRVSSIDPLKIPDLLRHSRLLGTEK